MHDGPWPWYEIDSVHGLASSCDGVSAGLIEISTARLGRDEHRTLNTVEKLDGVVLRRQPIELLSSKERTILTLFGEGRNSAAIARRLKISP